MGTQKRNNGKEEIVVTSECLGSLSIAIIIKPQYLSVGNLVKESSERLEYGELWNQATCTYLRFTTFNLHSHEQSISFLCASVTVSVKLG